jgi:pimeloyl-ACP methyl ester carboxylesterase
MTKPDIILLHGALASEEQFLTLKVELSKLFNVFSFSFSGHGGVASKGLFSLDLFINDVLQFMKKERLDSSHFFGYSMGGYIALAFAEKFPLQVNKIVTLATKFEWTEESAAREIGKLDVNLIEAKVPDFARSLQKLHSLVDWKEVVSKTAKFISSLGNGEALDLSYFQRINQEVLICLCENDRMVGREESIRVATNLPNAKFQSLHDCSHPFSSCDSAKLALLIERFIFSSKS